MHRVTRPELKRHDERNRLEPRRLPPSPGGGPRPREAETILGHQPGPQRNGLTKESPRCGAPSSTNSSTRHLGRTQDGGAGHVAGRADRALELGRSHAACRRGDVSPTYI